MKNINQQRRLRCTLYSFIHAHLSGETFHRLQCRWDKWHAYRLKKYRKGFFSILPGIYVQCPRVHPRILVCSPKLVPGKELSKGITSFFSPIYDAFEFLLMVGTPHKPLFKTDAMPPNVLFKNVIGALLKP